MDLLKKEFRIDPVWASLMWIGGALWFSLLLTSGTEPAQAICLVCAGFCNYRGITRSGRTGVDVVANVIILVLVVAMLVGLVWSVRGPR